MEIGELSDNDELTDEKSKGLKTDEPSEEKSKGQDINEQYGVVKLLLEKHSQVNINIHSLNDVGLGLFTPLYGEEESNVDLMKNLGGAGGKLGNDKVAKGNIKILRKKFDGGTLKVELMPVTEGGIAGTSMTDGDGKVVTETFDVIANDFKFNVQLFNLDTSSSPKTIEMKFEIDGSVDVVKHEPTGNYIWPISHLEYSSRYFASDDEDGKGCVSCSMDDGFPKLEKQKSGEYTLILQFKVPGEKTCIFYDPVLKHICTGIILASSITQVDGFGAGVGGSGKFFDNAKNVLVIFKDGVESVEKGYGFIQNIIDKNENSDRKKQFKTG